MRMQSFRKGLLIFLAYISIIIGIFVLQFRTDSTIIEKIGALQVTLEKQENTENEVLLKNTMVITYNGLNFFGDDQNPLKMVLKGDTKTQDLVLINWEKSENNKVTLHYSNDISLNFNISDDDATSPLSVSINMPNDVQSVYLPYRFTSSMKVQKDDGNRIILNNKKAAWNFSANEIEKDYIVFNGSEYSAHYALYTEEKRFSFDTITELAFADTTLYENTLSTFTNNLISSFKNIVSENNYSEDSVIAYVASMADKGRYQQAVEEIPSSYKKSSSRTYISSPYFNNLAKMKDTLLSELSSTQKDIQNAVLSSSNEIFMTNNFAAKLIILQNKTNVTSLLEQAAASDIENSTLAQVTAILKTYVELKEYNSELASLLAPALEKCIEKITAACDYDGTLLTLKENNQFLSVIQAVNIGTTLLRYGNVSNMSVYQKAGRVIVNSYLSEGYSFDIKTLTTLYPMLKYDNYYYPHFEILSQGNSLMWAWTCAKDITQTTNTDGELVLSIDFPEGDIHHVIFSGIPRFSSIYIYNMAYRTDPRFETYNSSGYVYNSDESMLLLKSRHKSQIETVRMVPVK